MDPGLDKRLSTNAWLVGSVAETDYFSLKKISVEMVVEVTRVWKAVVSEH